MRLLVAGVLACAGLVAFGAASAAADVVEDGTSLRDLGVTGRVGLSETESSYTLEGLRIAGGLSDPDADDSLAMEATVVVMLLADPKLEEREESTLTFSVNGKSTIQMRLVASDGMVKLHGNGWIDDDPNVSLSPGVPAKIEFANYLQYTSTDAENDELSIALDLTEGLAPYVQVEVLPETRFFLDVNPAQIVTLDIRTVEVDESVDEARIDYEVRSNRADFATMSLDLDAGLAGNFRNYDELGEATDVLNLENGSALGTAIVDLEADSRVVRGTLVAATSFNSPAETFTYAATQDDRRYNWPIIGLMVALILGLVALRVRR